MHTISWQFISLIYGPLGERIVANIQPRVDRKSDPAGAPREWRGSGVHPGLSGREIASCPFPARSRPPMLRTPSCPTLPPAHRMAIVIAHPEGIGIFPGDRWGLRLNETWSPPRCGGPGWRRCLCCACAKPGPTARSHTRFREGPGFPVLSSLSRGVQGRLFTPCLHKGTYATESVWGSVCLTAVHSYHHFQGDTCPLPPPARRQRVPGWVGYPTQRTVPTRKRVRTGDAFFARCQPAKPRLTCLDGRLSLLSC